MKQGSILAGILISAAGLWAQQAGFGVGVGRGGAAAGSFREDFQQVVTMDSGQPGVKQFIMAHIGPGEGISGQTVTGRPVSGTEEHKSMQTLSDGTVITNSTNDGFYRDSAGRTRVESGGEVTIYDPVAHQTIVLMTESKRARVMPMPEIVEKGGGTFKVDGPVMTRSFNITNTVGTTTATATVAAAGPIARFERTADNVKKEDLGVESLNGTLATHTRSTLTIPQGQIGNDRDIHVVNERWYSDDLQMLVKTVNSDPRFGQNTYEFTNISREEPDASLFQIPSGYTVVELGAKQLKQ